MRIRHLLVLGLAALIVPLFCFTEAHAQDLFERAFPELEFERPMAIRNAGDGTNLLYVAEQTGRVYAFPNDDLADSKTLLLDLSDSVFFEGQEPGLLGLAFNPGYATNRKFYVYYITESGGGETPFRALLSEFTAPSAEEFENWDELAEGVRSSEVVLLDIARTDSQHNGGDVHFGIPEGPEGQRYLYVSLGDGECCRDPLSSGQDRTTLLGSLLRLDVDNPSSGLNYGIPSDNPYVDNSEGWREEIWAYGFRNPWRFSIDPITGRLWLGDVGEETWEEVNLVTRGGNYGWKISEGPECFLGQACDLSGLVEPVWAYTHEVGLAVTGGYVYRGARAPALEGWYVFADWGRRKLWALSYDPESGGEPEVALLSDFTGYFVSSFGTDESGELYVLNTFLGDIFRFKENPPINIGEGPSAPAALTLDIAGANPFRSQTQFEALIPEAGPIRIAVYNILGQEV